MAIGRGQQHPSGRRPPVTSFANLLGVILFFATLAGMLAAGATPLHAQAAPLAVGSQGPVRAVDARLVEEGGTTTFELPLSEGVVAEVYTLAEPYRVIIDLPDVTFKMKPGAGKTGAGLVTAFRYGLFAERKARVVIDTSGPVQIAGAKMERDGGMMVLRIALTATDAASFGAGTGAVRDSAPEAAVATPDTAPQPPKAAPRGKPVVVIDPGHGGIDPGATGANNVLEKGIVLAVAQELKAYLLKTGRFDVRMTRDKDVFISLDRRVKFSQENNADLFISLHADSIEEKGFAEAVRGATIYTLSERASDEQARMMAEKENASDLLAGIETGDSKGRDQVKSILIDLLKRETSNFSADFSNVLSKRLARTIAMSKDPQRSAAFKVLKQTHAPSVLVELGYLSNSQDQQQLAAAGWQKQVAAAMGTAIQAYFGKRTAEQP